MTPITGYKTWRPLMFALAFLAGMAMGYAFMQMFPAHFRYRGMKAVLIMAFAPALGGLFLARLLGSVPGIFWVDKQGLWWRRRGWGEPAALFRFEDLKGWRFSSSVFSWFLPFWKHRKVVVLEFFALASSKTTVSLVFDSEDKVVAVLGYLDRLLPVEPRRKKRWYETDLRYGIGILIVAAGIVIASFGISTGLSRGHWIRGPQLFVAGIIISILGVRVIMGL